MSLPRLFLPVTYICTKKVNLFNDRRVKREEVVTFQSRKFTFSIIKAQIPALMSTFKWVFITSRAAKYLMRTLIISLALFVARSALIPLPSCNSQLCPFPLSLSLSVCPSAFLVSQKCSHNSLCSARHLHHLDHHHCQLPSRTLIVNCAGISE